MDLVIRKYKKQFESEWLKCHAMTYLHSNERRIEHSKPKYTGRAIELVAIVDKKIVGYLDIELENTLGSMCYKKSDGNGMLWDIGVLPEYRRKGVATKLLDEE